MSADRLAAFVARCCCQPRELRLEVRALRGGLESVVVAEGTARFYDARDREGTPAREADIYQHLVSPLCSQIAPALLGIERHGLAECLLFLERVRPVRRWPWRERIAPPDLCGHGG